MQTNRRQVTIAMIIATFLASIEVTIVSTAMPRIVSDLGGIQLISWVFAIYLLTSAVTTPIYGKLADLFGRKIIFTVGTVLFLAGSMLSGLSQTMTQLILFRALQGIGAGAILPTTSTIIGDIYPYEQRAKIQGLFSAIWGLSGIIGPLVGGFLVDFVTWRWIFYLNIPFGLIAVVMLWIFLKEDQLETGTKKKIDYWGALTFTIAVTSFIYALLAGGTTYAWDSPVMIGLFLIGGLFLVIFFWIESKFSEPMLPLPLFKVPAIIVSNSTGFLSSMILIGITVYLPLWVQGVYGQGATEAGLALLPMSIGWPIGATWGGRLMLKIGPRKTAVLGLIALLFGSIWLSMVSAQTPYGYLIVIMSIIGFGFGFMTTVMSVVVQSSVEWNMRGVANSSNTFLRMLGQTLGVAIFGTMFNRWVMQYIQSQPQSIPIQSSDLNKLLDPNEIQKLPSVVIEVLKGSLESSIHHIFILLVVIAAATLLVSFWFPRQKPEVQNVVTTK
ncbi:MDR family MFS transporter [Hazenella coriacea]|uniref:EmrB/QacA subfamily drug resistance transporter n=1 Tax=Hazenella coriacea TaxID=1179467 RepID=A0A4R3L322_9BACL|nr:MDR family MFS transporter [Hazenella coriacea]TCS92853.1 EmrB/QacA subfamily drug resistance transporter [Hazenella coriacea]